LQQRHHRYCTEFTHCFTQLFTCNSAELGTAIYTGCCRKKRTKFCTW